MACRRVPGIPRAAYPGCGGRQKIEQVLGIHLDRYVLRTLG